MMTPQERAGAVVKHVRDNEKFNILSDEQWTREISNAIQAALADQIPAIDFLELYDAAHAVIDHIENRIDHSVYQGSMNAVGDFREISSTLRWKHDGKFPEDYEP